MSSIIEGYNYDIFISYRQKDNKGERWVSIFVEALKNELDSTFKKDISVYFDENPHDRLLETHNVDKSLEGKLKSLILIPVLSQTYCDPESYAWQSEFMPFVRMAQNDTFGKDVKLRGGNVASRILPVRIHDLDPEDIELFERETGSVLRSLDFVFRTSAGVNRPLTASDNPEKNLNKTFYRDQINKTANAIKEIISGLMADSSRPAREKTEKDEEILHEESKYKVEEPDHKPQKNPSGRLFAGFLIVVVLVIAAILAYPKIFRQDTLEKLRSSGKQISVAVMPFQNMTGDTTWNIWQNGFQNELITSLTNSEELKIRPTESVNSLIQSKNLTNYASMTPSVAGNISKKLGADIFVLGSMKKAGKTIRVNAQLIDSKTINIFKSFQIDGTEEKILNIVDSISTLVRDFLIISVMEKEIIRDFRQLISTPSSEAYRYYMYGNQSFYKGDLPTASEWYKKAIDIDSTFSEAIRMLVYSFGNRGLAEEAREWVLRNYKRRDQMSEQQRLWANIQYAQFFGKTSEVVKYFKLLVAYNDEMPVPHSNLGGTYLSLKLYGNAISEYEKELAIYKSWGTKPRGAGVYVLLGQAYHETGMYNKEKKLYKRAEQDFPGSPQLIYRQAVLALSEDQTKKASDYIEKYIFARKAVSASEAAIAFDLARIYDEANLPGKAEEYYRKALSLRPNSPTFLYYFAFLLIDKNLNVEEGLELIEKAFSMGIDETNYTDCKGWGLYRQGRYEEALTLFQKNWDQLSSADRDLYVNHNRYIHLEAAKKAVAEQREN